MFVLLRYTWFYTKCSWDNTRKLNKFPLSNVLMCLACNWHFFSFFLWKNKRDLLSQLRYSWEQRLLFLFCFNDERSVFIRYLIGRIAGQIKIDLSEIHRCYKKLLQTIRVPISPFTHPLVDLAHFHVPSLQSRRQVGWTEAINKWVPCCLWIIDRQATFSKPIPVVTDCAAATLDELQI